MNWDNSKATRIPAEVVEQLHLETNQKLPITIQDDLLILTSVQTKPENIHDQFRLEGEKVNSLKVNETFVNEYYLYKLL